MDLLWSEFLGPSDIVYVVGIPAVDQNVSGLEEWP
jgi:hypothetical protein